jgi:hypothetical protein
MRSSFIRRNTTLGTVLFIAAPRAVRLPARHHYARYAPSYNGTTLVYQSM